MKRIPLYGYLGVLLASLALAYFTWTKGPEAADGDVTILACGKGDIRQITLREKERKVVFDPRRSAWSGETIWWVEAYRLPFKPADRPGAEPSVASERDLEEDVAYTDPAVDVLPEAADSTEPEAWIVSESFLGNERLGEALEGFCPWKGLRSLGKPGGDKREEFGLTDSLDSLVLDVRGRPRSFRIGKSTFGPGDRYVEDEHTGEMFLVKGQSIKDLLYPKSRYMERTLHAFEEDRVARIRLREGNRELELVRSHSPEGRDLGWAEAGRPEEPDALYGNWVRKLMTLRPMDYVVPEEGLPEAGPYGCTTPPGARIAVSVIYFGDKREIGFLTVYKKIDEEDKGEYLACTERTNALVMVSKIQAENLISDLPDILPEP